MRAQVERIARVSVVGVPDTVRAGLRALLAETGAEELIATGQIYDHAARLRSFEILVEVRETLDAGEARSREAL